MGVVHHDDGAMLVGEVADLGERRDRAVHREDPVGRDELHAGGLRLDQLRLEVGQVAIGVAESLGLAEADAVDDRGMVERVGDDRVLRAEDRLEEAAVGVPAGGVEDRILGAEEVADRRLEFAVDRLGAADEPDGAEAVAPALERGGRGGLDLRVVRQAEVVVRAQVERLAAILEPDARTLGGVDEPFLLVEPARADIGEALGEEALERGVHGVQGWVQSRTTLPDCPDSMASKPRRNSRAGRRCVIAGVMSTWDCSSAIILYQVSYISRP